MENTEVKKEEIPGRRLIDFVFSWSVKDVLNENLYKNQVRKIPETFTSTTEYKTSFCAPLVEETHADLLSSMSTLSLAPWRVILHFMPTKDFKPPNDLFYHVILKSLRKFETDDGKEFVTEDGRYEPEARELIAITNVRPKCIADLETTNRSYLVAFVLKVKEDHYLRILSSKPILFEEDKNKRRETLYAIPLINMTTNIRIWRALNSKLEGGNSNIIRNVLQPKYAEARNCTACSTDSADMRSRFSSSDLNDSQKEAVLSCLVTRKCNHQNTVKLIWGPPGTGKTRTVGLLLFSLLRLRCRTLTCAPTNNAVLEVAQRLLNNVTESLEYGTYGLGDVILFGNGKRMKIVDRHDLLDVFLDNRVDILLECLVSSYGWKGSLVSMICLLEDPKQQYDLYLNDRSMIDNEEEKTEGISKNKETNRNQGKVIDQSFEDNKKSKKNLNKVIVQALNENKNKKKHKEMIPSHKENKLEDEDGSSQNKCEYPLSFEEFVQRRFKRILKRLEYCSENLYTHLPTFFISLEVVKNMNLALDFLKSLETLLCTLTVADKRLKRVSSENEQSRLSHIMKSSFVREDCLRILKSLPQKFSVPDFKEENGIKKFCLENSCLTFCTVSSSAKLHKVKAQWELLVIDEAAQLKECESTIPLQLPGLRHAILFGDEWQLPAMVKSKVSEEAEFGRSLFQRLVLLGHKKDLLKVQHRMHPSISLFPNRMFYENQILDGPNVQERSYDRRFLQGNMYGSYSFINVAHGKEEFDKSHSLRNVIEVAVASEIVASLFKESVRTKKVKVGIISPYKAQVYAIEEKVKKYNADSNSDFSISVRSVDGFQGGEEDVIIMSTVRSNMNGVVGFLKNHQRTNVALTRARHCLWILGNEATLTKKFSIWKELVIDAKKRRCFYNADEDKSLAQAITVALIEHDQIHTLLNMDSFLFRKTMWKVSFSNDFLKSMSRVKNPVTCKEVLTVLENLANGWRQPYWKENHFFHRGTSSQLLEQYKVNELLNLVWTVDILKENAYYIQILKVWEILPLSEMTRLANHLDVLFENYTVDTMNRCKHKCLNGCLVVPMRWPIDSSISPKADPVLSLSEPLASLSLRDDLESSSSTYISMPLVGVEASVAWEQGVVRFVGSMRWCEIEREKGQTTWREK